MRVIAPSPEVVAAANEAARDVHFVAVAGEGWIGWGASAGGDDDDARRRRRRLRAFPGTTGRSENNDGLVLVAAGHTGAKAKTKPFPFVVVDNTGRVDGGGKRESLRAKWHSSEDDYPWWYPRTDGDVDGPPPAADPTLSLIHI